MRSFRTGLRTTGILLCGIAAAAAVPVTAAAAAPAAEPDCRCSCRQCPPRGKPTRNERGEPRYRGCFSDRNEDKRCDNSVKAGKKCKNNCVLIAATGKDGKRIVPHPCAGCPCPTNCARCAVNAPNRK